MPAAAAPASGRRIYLHLQVGPVAGTRLPYLSLTPVTAPGSFPVACQLLGCLCVPFAGGVLLGRPGLVRGPGAERRTNHPGSRDVKMNLDTCQYLHHRAAEVREQAGTAGQT